MGDSLIELEEIQKEKVILTEGDDDKNFITKFLEFETIDGVQVISLGGQTKIRLTLPLFFTRGDFDIIRKLAIIRDADTNSESKFESTVNHIRNNNLVPPNSINSFSNEEPNVGVYIITKLGCNYGMLEDICLETVKDTEAMNCVEIFFECINKLPNRPENPSKSKCQAYRAALPISYPSVGVAALNRIWPFEHNALDGLRVFLQNFRD